MTSEALAAPVQACGSKLAPTASPVSGDGGGRGGGYVHTSLETSSPHKAEVFVGSTIKFLEKERKRKKIHMLLKLDDALKELGREDERKSLWSCGRYFRYGVWQKCDTKVLLGYHCKSVFCPDCARLRARPYQTKIWNVVKQDKSNYFHMVLTLETKEGEPLTRNTIDRMIHAFRDLREENAWSEWIEGGFYSIEAVYNTGKERLPSGKFAVRGWHPHIHVLMKSKGWLPDAWLAQIKFAWLKHTGDSSYVRVDRVYALDSRGRQKKWRINEQSVKEIVKYSTKAMKFCGEARLVGEFLDAFKNVRRLQAFGSFVGIAKQAKKEADSELNPESQEGRAPCKCGMCMWSQLTLFPAMFHVSDTVLQPDGKRVLREGISPPDEGSKLEADSVPEAEFESRQERLREMAFVAATLPFDSSSVVVV